MYILAQIHGSQLDISFKDGSTDEGKLHEVFREILIKRMTMFQALSNRGMLRRLHKLSNRGWSFALKAKKKQSEISDLLTVPGDSFFGAEPKKKKANGLNYNKMAHRCISDPKVCEAFQEITEQRETEQKQKLDRKTFKTRKSEKQKQINSNTHKLICYCLTEIKKSNKKPDECLKCNRGYCIVGGWVHTKCLPEPIDPAQESSWLCTYCSHMPELSKVAEGDVIVDQQE